MIWETAVEKLSTGQRVFLLLVLESKGSSPGRQGFKMMVASDGTMEGSIGGGIMEHKFVELVKSRFSSSPGTPEVFLQVHDKTSSSRSGMICSGEQTLLVKELFFEDLSLLEAFAQSAKENGNHTIQISDQGLMFSKEASPSDFHFERCGEEAFIYRERTGKKNILHIVGGGHCSLALSRLMSNMDFTICVYDTRADLNTLFQNTFANTKAVVQNYAQLSSYVEPGQNVYVIIMTFGYRTDDEALRSLINIPVKYLGMIGSKRKIEQMFNTYKAEGIDGTWLQKVHAPAGINIKSETPEEIAVSIAAEMIRIKNTGQ